METLLYNYKFQSMLPVRGATKLNGVVLPGLVISIHAPRAGSDTSPLVIMGAVV